MEPSFFKKLGPISINEIKSLIDCKTINISDDELFNDIVSINKISSDSLSFLHDNEDLSISLPENCAIIITDKKLNYLDSNQKLIIVRNVQETVANISQIFYRDFEIEEIENFASPSIGDDCKIASNAIIENGAVIGNNVQISYGAVIKTNCVIGNGCFIGPNAVISNTILGEDIYIGSNSSIGQRGFGFHLNNNGNKNIFHSGKVIIHSKVSSGSCCAIDRGSFNDTVIGENTYIDNLCHVAHNVEIGRNSAFAAMTGIAGSAKLGDNVLTGGQAGIAGHISIGNNVQIAAKSGVFNDLKDGDRVMGNPAINKFKFLKKYKKIYGKR